MSVKFNPKEKPNLGLVSEERWRIWAELCKHIPKGTEQSDLMHKIIFEND